MVCLCAYVLLLPRPTLQILGKHISRYVSPWCSGLYEGKKHTPEIVVFSLSSVTPDGTVAIIHSHSTISKYKKFSDQWEVDGNCVLQICIALRASPGGFELPFCGQVRRCEAVSDTVKLDIKLNVDNLE